jgi:hypothetical protein
LTDLNIQLLVGDESNDSVVVRTLLTMGMDVVFLDKLGDK